MLRDPTELLAAWQAGDEGALNRLVEVLYDELRALAETQMRKQPAGHTLQPTALVHEAYVRFAASGGAYEDRAHFLAAAATVMRRVLVDHARGKRRRKRGGGAASVTFTEGRIGATDESDHIADILSLDTALQKLSAQSPRKGRAVELRFFGGMTLEELASVLGVSVGTAHRELRLATAWLQREMTA